MPTLLDANKHVAKTVEFTLKLDYYFSGNCMYVPQSAGRGKAWLRKHPLAFMLQYYSAMQIREMGLEGCAPKDCFAYRCTVQFQFNKIDWLTIGEEKLKKLDLSNLWDPIEDGIFKGLKDHKLRGLGVDDSKCIKLILEKVLIEEKTPPFRVALTVVFLV